MEGASVNLNSADFALLFASSRAISTTRMSSETESQMPSPSQTQGLRPSRHLLFLCSRNRLRSPTAQQIFADYADVETDSAGLSPDADTLLSAEQVEWADVILVMEKIHRERLTKRFGSLLKGKQVAVLGIPDLYDFMQPELIHLLQQKCARYVR